DDENILGEGGFSKVYLARNEREGTEQALKILKKEYEGDDRVVASFFRDPGVMMSLDHPNIIRIFDVGSPGESPFYHSMEYCAGGDLKNILQRRGRLPITTVLHHAITLCGALAYCHGRGIFHRDIKASNILYRDADTPVLSDFGTEVAGLELIATRQCNVGSPPYLSPEVWESRSYDARSDLYSFGVLLYFAVTGRLPFVGGTLAEYRTLHRTKAPLPPSTWTPTVARDLDTVILALLEKNANDRISSAHDLGEQLARIRGRFYSGQGAHFTTRLVLSAPPHERRGITVHRFPCRIGKFEATSGDQHNDLIIGSDDPHVSRFHAVIEKIDESYLFTDVSSNGTIVNGVKIHKQSVELLK
ncbi:MAG TPA: FHA domain-containing serine/threonine-protein kinase, partial [Terriglobia bacterium]|nr:FHA domain-containing serine/threonine-protein kinase [Terriglobia bacterium]